MKKTDRGRGESNPISWLDWMARLLKGGILAGVVTVLFMLVGACLISYGILSQDKMEGVVLGGCVIGTMIGAIFAIGPQGNRSIPMGLGVGLILFLLCLTAGMIIYGNESLGSGGVGVLCACLCGGAIGGILRRKGKKRGKR